MSGQLLKGFSQSADDASVLRRNSQTRAAAPTIDDAANLSAEHRSTIIVRDKIGDYLGPRRRLQAAGVAEDSTCSAAHEQLSREPLVLSNDDDEAGNREAGQFPQRAPSRGDRHIAPRHQIWDICRVAQQANRAALPSRFHFQGSLVPVARADQEDRFKIAATARGQGLEDLQADIVGIPPPKVTSSFRAGPVN